MGRKQNLSPPLFIPHTHTLSHLHLSHARTHSSSSLSLSFSFLTPLCHSHPLSLFLSFLISPAYSLIPLTFLQTTHSRNHRTRRATHAHTYTHKSAQGQEQRRERKGNKKDKKKEEDERKKKEKRKETRRSKVHQCVRVQHFSSPCGKDDPPICHSRHDSAKKTPPQNSTFFPFGASGEQTGGKGSSNNDRAQPGCKK